ncbi:MAG: cation diffusion facilitator family transporter [Bacillota bacterium]
MLGKEEKNRYGEQVCIHVLLLNILLAVIKMIAGIIGSSIALVADAFHSLSDVITTVGVIICLRISRRPPDKEHPYGHGKIESIAAKIISIILILVGVGMLVLAINKIIINNLLIPAEITLWAAGLSILVKEFSYRYTLAAAKKLNSTVLAADAWHHRSDAVSSVAALLGIAGARVGFPIFDPLMAGVVSVLIIWAGYKLLRDSIDELMDTLPDEQVVKEIYELCNGVVGVKKVRNVKIRKYGMYFMVDLVIVVDPMITVDEGHSLAAISRQKILEDNDMIKEVFIHVSPYENQQAPAWEQP